MTDTDTFALAVAVGPDPKEVDRIRDLADAIGHYEPTRRGWFLMIDDAAESRGLDRVVALPPNITPVSLPHPRHDRAQVFKVGKGIISAVLLAMKWTQANTDARFVLKLDTDSLVINPFADALLRFFDEHPTVGIVGAHTRTPNGSKRDLKLQQSILYRYCRPAFSIRHPLRRSRWQPEPQFTHINDLIETAKANGYTMAEHCMGGGYAVSRAMLDRLAATGLANDLTRWMGVDLSEDVMMGLHCRALDLPMADLVDEGDVFGIRYSGLAFPPDELAARGYSVIHAVKNDPNIDEASVRAYFKARRT